jgi:hypothetical protein
MEDDELVNKAPKAHGAEREGDSSDACLSTLHPKYALALQYLCLLCAKLGVSREIAVYTEARECGSSCKSSEWVKSFGTVKINLSLCKAYNPGVYPSQEHHADAQVYPAVIQQNYWY